jgi:non-ribosomal peptide synthetase component E (peptide arylation enzyme)
MKPTLFSPQLVKEYREKGYWDSTTWVDLWERMAEKFPDREALVDSRMRLTWAKTIEISDRMANSLSRLGLKRDEIVVIQLPNVVEFLLFRIACEKIGVIAAAAPRTFRKQEMEYILRDLPAAGVVIPSHFHEFDYCQMIHDIRPGLPNLRHVIVVGSPAPEGAIPAELMYQREISPSMKDRYEGSRIPATEVSFIHLSTGTTGFPKFCEWTDCTRMYVSKHQVKALKLNISDTYGVLCPLTGATGLTGYYTALMAGAKLVLSEAFEAESAFALMEKEKITVTAVVPTQLVKMLQHKSLQKYDLSPLRLFFTGGAELTYDVMNEAAEKFGCKVANVYGSSEGSLSITDIADWPYDKTELLGKPYEGTVIKLVDENGNEVPSGDVGEIWVKGPTIHSGYFKNEEANRAAWTEDGWLKMGDMGKYEQGQIKIVGREKDIIIRGGQNIYPGEIELILESHPKVANAAVVAMPDPVMGEKTCAFVTTKPGKEITFDEMASYFRDKNIAFFKIPERLEIVDSLPLVAGLKVDKKALREFITRKIESESKGLC